MSDLEKYYVLNTWLEENVKYNLKTVDNTEGRGQTAYDAMFSGEAVCTGRAKLYTLLCHQAGLACIVYSDDRHMNCVLPNVNGQALVWEPGYFKNAEDYVCDALGLKYTADEDDQFVWTSNWYDIDYTTGKVRTMTYEEWIKRNVNGYEGMPGEVKYKEKGSSLNDVSVAKYTADMDIYDYGLKKK